MFFLTDINSTAVLVISALAYLLYLFRKKYSYWEKKGFQSLGFLNDSVFIPSGEHANISMQRKYIQLAPHPCGGIYYGGQPSLLIRDPELVQRICIKDFSHFIDRGLTVVFEDINPLTANIFNISGAKWKNVRTKLTPIFTSGKLRSMYGLLDECTRTLGKYLERNLKTSGELDALEVMNKHTLDVIGTCAFGLQCSAVQDEASDFRRAIGLSIPSAFRAYSRAVLTVVCPSLIKLLRWKFMLPEAEEFFFSLTRDTIKHREENKEQRNDFLQLLINAQHEEEKMLLGRNDESEPLFTDVTITANVFLFFIAGFETTSLALSYCLYELALHPEAMEKLHAEIVKTLDKRRHLDYDALGEMDYLACVISETLRLHPSVGRLDRRCVKTYKIPNTSKVIEEGTRIVIPVYALHRDPQYFPEPEKFDPERFSAENKHKIVPGTYLPFGEGPRHCVGMRFAQMEIKKTLCQIISNYTVHPTAKTEIPVKMKSHSFLSIPRNGIHLRFEKRGA